MISFGQYINGTNYKVLNERVMRGSAGIMFLLGIIAFVNAFVLHNFKVVSYISGFLMLNFIIGIFINPYYSPTMLISKLFVRKQTPVYVGAVQKKFAWSFGLILISSIFILSLQLVNDISFFKPTCILCLICLSVIFLELSMGICLGCKFYSLALKLKLIPEPTERPNCDGDSCAVN